jgi:alginate O-acetyltransferase complex protein AlgI
MIFNSFEFIILLITTFTLYYLPILKKYQLQILILSSFIFYAYNRPLLLSILLLSIAINIVTSYFIVYGDDRYRRYYAVTGVALNLLILGFFKYSPLIGRTLFNTGSVGDFLISIPLPIGISFFTFQGISLVVDAYKNRPTKEYSGLIVRNIAQNSLRVTTFISFFAQLVAGPIVKAHEFLPQINRKFFKDIYWNDSFQSIITGYFLKMVIADNLKDQTFWIADPYFKGQSSLTLVFLLFGYSIQIFADFAGYSLIAIGVARLFGYKLKDNFNFPYISSSFSEFWKRWHISLSSFLKEYLYIPLGGNRKGELRTYINLLVTMILGGLWHGAAWSYAVWGGYHGILLALEKLIKNNFRGGKKYIPNYVLSAFVFACVTFGWLLFKLPNINHVYEYLLAIKNNLFLDDRLPIIKYITIYSLPVVVYHLWYLNKMRSYVAGINMLKPATYGIMLFLLITNSGSPVAFIYFQF